MARGTLPHNWAAEYTSHLVHLGFNVGRASPCNFVHDKRELALTVHGDDFVVIGDETQLQWLGDKMKSKYELKMDVLGPHTHQEKEVRALNRIIRWTRHGLEYEPDQRHEEKIVCDLGMEKAREVLTPCVQRATNPNADDGQKGLLQPLDATKFRSTAARINFLAADIPDLHFASKCASKYMANPTCEGLTVLKRIGRYLKAHQRVVQRFDWCAWQSELQGYADSDWAGDKSSYKSTSGGALMWGSHTLKTWATPQSTIALSSGEAELFAMTKVAADERYDELGSRLRNQFKRNCSVRFGSCDWDCSSKRHWWKVQAHQCPVFVDSRKCAGRTLGTSECAWKKESSRHDDEDSWSRNNAATFEVHEFQERCWESRKGFETVEFRDDFDLNISVVGACRNSRRCVGRR